MNTNKFLKALGFAVVLGFASFILSGNSLSWLLAVGVFYYEFMVRKDAMPAVRVGRK